MKIELDVQSCRECPHSTNNVIEHDDPFTSSPATVIWRCTKEGGPSYIHKPGAIDGHCPITAEKEKKDGNA